MLGPLATPRRTGALLLLVVLLGGSIGASAAAGQEPKPQPKPAAAQEPKPEMAKGPKPAGEPAKAAPQAPAFDPATLPDVVARVNGTDITRDQLVDEAKGAYEQLRGIGQKPTLDQAFFRGALDQRIASVLLEAEAKSRGIAATQEEIDGRLAEARARFDSDAAFESSLQKQGLTVEAARAALAQELARFKYIEEVIVPEIKISDEAVRSFYDHNLESMRQPERIKLRHILIQVPSGASEEDHAMARRRADDVLAKAKAGGDFAALAREHSDDGTGEQGGELPWIQKGQTLPQFEQAAFRLEKGAISDVVETQLGFHILQCLDRQVARLAEFDEVKDRIMVVLQSEEAQNRLRKTVEGLMAKANVERFAL